MTSINSVTLIGNLTRDLSENSMDFAYSPSGMARANVSVAVSKSRKMQDGTWQDEPSYFNVVIYGKTAENLKPYLKRGTKIGVLGYLKQDRWQDKQTGQNRERVVIVADNVQLCGGNSQNNSNSGFQNQNVQQANGYQQRGNFQQYPQQPAVSEGFQEDIPF